MKIVLVLVAALPGLAGASGPSPDRSGAGARPPDALAADTILWRHLLTPRPLQPAGTGGREPLLRLGLKPIHPPPALVDVELPGRSHPFLLPPGRTLASLWTERLARYGRTEAVLREALRRSVSRFGSDGRDVAFLPPADTLRPDPLRPGAARAPPESPETGEAPGAGEEGTTEELQAFVSEYADLGVRVQTRAELGGDWTRFQPCENRFQESCNPDLLPQLSPDLRFNVQVGGTITDRIHVDVDFDQLREFEGANTINIFYEGGPDDIIRRLELGDVTFRLPRSRFLTEGVPAGNFGFRATGQMGPVDFQAVWAEQKGDLSRRVFRLEGVGGQRRFVQEDTLEVDDADYARGQFFFLGDPELITGFPHIDILSLDAGAAPPDVLPGVEPVQVYRFENDPVQRQQVEGFIQADAVAEKDGDRVVESGWFRYLQPGRDYFVHPSGLWIALRNPLAREEMLAVTYITAAGDTVGDYNPERLYNGGERPELELLKASGANHQPDRPTWLREMHNVYRVSGSPDVEPASVEVTVSLGELSSGRTFKRAPSGEDVTFLRLFGLDEESPVDRVDPAVVYTPGRDVFQDQPPVRGTFLVFPTLEPFKRPPPLPSLGFTEAETAELLGDDANPDIYDDPDPFERDNGSRFRLTIPFRVRSEGLITSFSLGALGILPGSERIFLADQLLVRGVDYEIDYEVGQVRLTDPETLFAANPDAAVRATWEQKQIFRTAPTSVVGVTARTALGDLGALDFMGLYRTEKTLVNRPTLGVEPGAVAVGGVSGEISADAGWLDRLLDKVPGLRFAGGSEFSLEGEAALSLPDPNTRGDVFLDDFDASDERPLSLLAREWYRGSAPAFTDGAEDVLPPMPSQDDLAELVWQHTWLLEGVGGDSVGIHEGFLPRQEIDEQIRVAGNQVREPGLRLGFGERGLVGGSRWASVTTVLSATGTDLTKAEFLEFYAAGGEPLTLILDLGTVNEDAMFVDREGRTSGVKSNGAPWGLGLLDQEADPLRGEIWGDEADERGVWGETCRGEPGRIYRIGDPRAVCTRNNGRNDSEDLDGDSNLDTREKHLRYVVRLDGSSRFLARDLDETGTDFRLYRIPLEGLAALEVGGAITEADMRAVRHLRLTLAGERSSSVTLARMRIVGSRWIKRAQEGVLRGIVGDTAALSGRVEVTPVSRLSEGESYQSPPGVLEELADPTTAFAGQGLEFNEKSLAVRFEEVQSEERVEVYNRFPQRPRNFLSYREARLWAVARSGDFGEDRPTFFFLKVGTDPENFYLFRTRLRAPPSDGVVASDWLPEVVVEFDRWFALRRAAEQILTREPRSPGAPPLAVWSADSTYAVVLSDRGRAPDLANVRELAVGVWNRSGQPVSGEFWIDELRLSGAVRDAGLAGHLDARLDAADVLQTRVTFSGRGAFFRQLEQAPTYQSDRTLSVRSRLRLDRFAPASWGVEVPLSVSHERVNRNPTFLANSDVQADRLRDLRDTETDQTRVSVGFRKSAPSANPVLSALLDGLEANLSWFRSRNSTVTSELESEGIDLRVDYARRLDRRDVALVPDFLRPVVRWLLPSFLEDDVVDARLRWTPERFRVGTSYLRHDNDVFRFEQIIELPGDTGVVATRAPREGMESAAELSFQPFESMSADFTLLSTRDLLRPREAVSDPVVQRLLADERARVAGVDLGWETNRVLRTRFGLDPSFVEWLSHSLEWNTSFLSDRNATFVERIAAGPDTTAVLERNTSGERDLRATASLDPGALGRALLGRPDSVAEGEEGGVMTVLLDLFRPVTVSWQEGLTSRFIRDPVGPGLGYQLGFGGRDDFRFVDRDTAATLTDRSTLRLGSGLTVPAVGLDLEVGYATSDADILDTRSDRTVRDETWPDVRARIRSPGGAQAVFDRVGVSVGFQRNVRETAFGGLAQQRRVLESWQVPFDVTLGWAGSVTVGYAGSVRRGDGVDPTGDTERDRSTHRLSFSSSFVPPGGFSRTLDRPVRLGAIFSYTSERECRETSFSTGCVAFVDQINRALNLTLDTQLRSFEIGLQASWTDRQSFVGRRAGSTQFQLGLFGQFLFEAGVLPGGAVPGA